MILLAGLLAVLLSSQQAPQGAIDVHTFGAKGDGHTDDTAAFQRALTAAGQGGTVYAPPGNYDFKGSLDMPPGVALIGSWQSVPAHNGIRDKGLPKPTDGGTTFLVQGGRGSEAGPPFVTVSTNDTLKGVVIYYPDQDPAKQPEAYPYAIAMRGKNPAVLDVELLNPYNGIDASQNERHLIRNVQGQPLRRGIFVDAIYDIGRIENVHFNPWWSVQPAVLNWQQEHGEAFIFGRSDWQYCLNTFAFGYNVGYRFIETANGSCNGNFVGIGADDSFTAIQVDQCAPFGLLITNGEFVSFHGPDPTMLRVSASNTGEVKLSNCAFWGPCNRVAVIDGKGVTSLSDCTLVQWGGKQGDQPAIDILGGNAMIRGCSFREDKLDVRIGPGAGKVVLSDSMTPKDLRVADFRKL